MTLLLAENEAIRSWSELFVRLAPLIVILGLVGIFMIFGLLVAWRRFQQRETKMTEQKQGRNTPSLHIDTWGSAGQRLEAANQSRQSGETGIPAYEEEASEPDEDSEENAPWRESLGDIPDFGAGGEDDDLFGDQDEGADGEDPDEDWPRPA